MNSLEALLKRINRDRKGGVLVVIEGTYGMTGDLANMVDICRLKDEYGARLYVDDAHGTGVMGENGRGIGEYYDVQDKIDLYFGTFAKAFASIGGFTAGPKEVVDWIRYNARTQVFAKSLPMVYVRSLMKTLELIKSGNDRREKMWTISNRLKDGLRDLGLYVGPGKAPICPVFLTLPEELQMEMGKKMVLYLRNNGIYVSPVAYPVIPRGLIMFRMIPTAAHSEEDVDQTLKVFKQMRDELTLETTISEDQMQKIGALFSGNV
jgi:glycine C-acetyltransferase